MELTVQVQARRRLLRRLITGTALTARMATAALAQKTAQKPLTWDDAKREFEAANPILRAGQIGIQESRADEQAARVRDTISFFYQRGGSSLVDFLQAQQDYRTIQLSYLNLVGSFLTAAAQMSVAVGREVVQ